MVVGPPHFLGWGIDCPNKTFLNHGIKIFGGSCKLLFILKFLGSYGKEFCCPSIFLKINFGTKNYFFNVWFYLDSGEVRTAI